MLVCEGKQPGHQPQNSRGPARELVQLHSLGKVSFSPFLRMRLRLSLAPRRQLNSNFLNKFNMWAQTRKLACTIQKSGTPSCRRRPLDLSCSVMNGATQILTVFGLQALSNQFVDTDPRTVLFLPPYFLDFRLCLSRRV